jgi:hypothetical protein
MYLLGYMDFSPEFPDGPVFCLTGKPENNDFFFVLWFFAVDRKLQKPNRDF